MSEKQTARAARAYRPGLTLIELVVVIAILAVLAMAIIPKLDGLTGQANSGATAAMLADVNSAVATFESRSKGFYPNSSDGLLKSDTATAFYEKFHPNIQFVGGTGTLDPMKPILYPLQLKQPQLDSLKSVGITNAHYNTDTNNATGLPSDSGTSFAMFAVDDYVAGLYIPLASGTTPVWTAHGSTFPDRAFNLSPWNYGGTDSFVVFGIGQPGQLRGKAMHDAPIVQSADPSKYYARVLIVFRVPGPTATTSFPAKYVGAFSPDGTSINDNAREYAKSANTY